MSVSRSCQMGGIFSISNCNGPVFFVLFFLVGDLTHLWSVVQLRRRDNEMCLDMR